MADWIKEILLYGLPALFTGFAGWLFGRGRQREEIHALEMDNVSKAIEIWRKTAEDVEAKCERLYKEVAELKTNHAKLADDYRKLAEDYRKLHEENEGLRNRIRKLEEENLKLRKRLEKP